MSKTSQDEPMVYSAPLVDFLNTLPSPLTTTLVGLAPAIAHTRHALQVITWRAPREECWLVLSTWWAICLVPEIGLRYMIPLAVIVLILRARFNPTLPLPPAPVTEETIQRAIADLSTIHAILLPLPNVRVSSSALPPAPTLLRAAAILYIPYLILTHLVRVRILLAIAGTVALTWRSRWAALLRNALWRSAHLRWALYRLWSRLSGTPLLLAPRSPQAKLDAKLVTLASPAQEIPATSVRFLFTIYENQRWWMGLDWTAALLPGERPSWCSATQQPAAPPSAFTLPAPTTAYTRGPDGSSRVKRTARWRWEEPEWRVVVRREGERGASRVERPVPSAKEESAAAASASRILKAAGKMRGGSVDAGTREDGRENTDGHRTDDESTEGDAHAAPEDGEEPAEPCTDADGWVYADNKWEGASGRGGMGKYTRFRRWTRVAVLTETVELVGPGPLGVQRDGEPAPPSSPAPAPDTPASPALAPPSASGSAPPSPIVLTQPRALPAMDGGRSEPSTTETNAHAAPQGSVEEGASRLTQRLKAAVKGATGQG